MDCLIATLSVDPVLKSHEEWIRNVVAHCDNKIEVKFLIVLEMLTEVFPKRTE
jgi:1-Cys peroxiredoxin 6